MDGPRAIAALSVPFDQLYREHFEFVYATLLRLGVASAAIDDATQDVFITAHRRVAEFEGRATLRSWLFGIARRIAFRYRRTAQRTDAKLRALAGTLARAQDLADEHEQRERGTLLLRALDLLDEDKRTAITLHAFEDLRGPELAAFLGIPLDTAYSRIKAARRELSKHLLELGGPADPDALVEAARRTTTPDRADRRRVAALVAARIGLGTRALVGASWTWSGLIGAMVIASAGTIVVGPRVPTETPPRGHNGAAPMHAIADSPSPAHYVAEFVAPPGITAAASDPPADPQLSDRHRDGSKAKPPTTVEPRPHTRAESGLAEEVAIMAAAKRALDRGAPAVALRELDLHAHQFSAGQLVRERAGYRAIALCELGRLADGRREARAFLVDHPSSALAPRVRRACIAGE